MDTSPRLNVLESEYKRLLGYPPDHEVDGRSKELIDSTTAWYAQHGQPWIYLKQAESLKLIDGSVAIEDHPLSSKKLFNQYDKAAVQSAIIAVVSAGIQCEEEARKLWKQGHPDEYFFMEMYGSAVAEFLISSAGHTLCTLADERKMSVLPHYSPGYTGWDITDQITLMKLLKDGNQKSLSERIDMLSSGMLIPKKSLVGLFGIASASEQVQKQHNLIPCHSCALSGCTYRRKPYQRARRHFEQAK